MLGCFECLWERKFTIAGFLGDLVGVIITTLLAAMIGISLTTASEKFSDIELEAYRKILNEARSALVAALLISVLSGLIFLFALCYSIAIHLSDDFCSCLLNTPLGKLRKQIQKEVSHNVKF